MEATGEVEFGSLLDKIQPPGLEDAGLEDCALPPDSIQEAFLKAASAVRSRIFHTTSDDESEGECINDPLPENGSSGDTLVGISTEADRSGSCLPKKGGELPVVHGDEVVVGGREGMPDKVVEPELPDEAEKSCVDGLQGLKIGENKVVGETKSKKSETNAELNGSSGDTLVGISTEADRSGSCLPKKGGELPVVHGDEVVVGGREGMPDKVVEPELPDEAEKSCVDGLQGLKIGENKVVGETKSKKSETNAELNEDDDEEDEKIPVLTEVCI